MELYARVRRAVHVEGRSQREVAREFGLARKTVRKMLAYPAPPGYQRQKPIRRPKLGRWQAAIDALLEEDKSRPRRQRHAGQAADHDGDQAGLATVPVKRVCRDQNPVSKGEPLCANATVGSATKNGTTAMPT